MKKYFIIGLIVSSLQVNGQQFITAGSIEFEAKVNVWRQNEGNEWFERLKDRVSQFNITYYNYVFAGNKSVYQFARKGYDPKGANAFWGGGEDESVWYNDYTKGEQTKLTTLDDNVLMSSAQRQILWKLDPADQRQIAGFNCRKAQTILFDSVYVFAYYTDEIKISGGPMGLHGLPGMILGVTIPRLYTSWIATGVKLTTPAANDIKPPTKGKQKNETEIRAAIAQLAKSMGSNSKKWLDMMMWKTLL